MRGERNALFQNRKLITWKWTGYCEANAERVLNLRYMRKTAQTPAEAFNGKYTTPSHYKHSFESRVVTVEEKWHYRNKYILFIIIVNVAQP